MGIIPKNKILTKEKQISDFLSSHSCWGHKKQYLKHTSNKHVLGLRNSFVIFNGEHFLEYSNRCSFFCFNTINIGGSIVFINSNVNYKKLTLFFACRSLQRFYVDKWLGGLITNNLFYGDVPDILIVSNLNRDTLVLKEASSKLIPVVCIEDSDHPLHKSFYSVFANDDKKDSIHFFYGSLSNSIIKSFLVKHSHSLCK